MADTGLLAAANQVRADAAARDPWLMGVPLAGIGWATVELERAAEDLTAAFVQAGMPEPAWIPAQRHDLLGASAWVSREWWPTWGAEEPPAIVLLEPDTEGRLAATLARFGEGVGAVYVAPLPHEPPNRVDAARLGRPAAGPLGAGRLVLARPAWGPNVIVLDRRMTAIRSPAS